MFSSFHLYELSDLTNISALESPPAPPLCTSFLNIPNLPSVIRHIIYKQPVHSSSDTGFLITRLWLWMAEPFASYYLLRAFVKHFINCQTISKEKSAACNLIMFLHYNEASYMNRQAFCSWRVPWWGSWHKTIVIISGLFHDTISSSDHI
jgi:hypothetical protein